MPGPRSFWDRVRRDPDAEADRVAWKEGDIVQRARQAAKESRTATLVAKLTFERIDLARAVSRFVEPLDGWDGDDRPSWRMHGLVAATGAFEGPPFSEWMMGMVALPAGLPYHASWVRLWLYDEGRIHASLVDPNRMRDFTVGSQGDGRHSLRCSHRHLDISMRRFHYRGPSARRCARPMSTRRARQDGDCAGSPG